ncbi:MAG: hypothetical protein V3T17_03435, partial [Pseudomonadales bacterium]
MNAAVPEIDNHSPIIEVRGIRQAQKCMSIRYCEHNLISSTADLRMRFRELEFNSLSIGYLEYDANVTVEISDTENFFFVGLPIKGEVKVDHCDVKLVASSSQGMVLSPSKPIELGYTEESRGRIVKISRTAVEQLLATMLGRPIT